MQRTFLSPSSLKQWWLSTSQVSIENQSNSLILVLYSNVGVDHHVHQCLQQLAQDFLCQDGRRVAHIQPLASLYWGSGSHIHGHSQVFLVFWFNFCKKNNRDDEDREINHHGRPVEVGEPENMQQANNVIKVFCNKNNHNGNFSNTKRIICTMCQGCWERSCVCGRKDSAEGIENFLQQVITIFFYTPQSFLKQPLKAYWFHWPIKL